MGYIKTSYDLAKDLTVVKATGKMTADEFRKWRSDYYSGKPTLNMIWDVIDADLSEIKNEDVLPHVQQINVVAAVRKGGKTAIVVGENLLALGLSRMRETYGEMENSPIEIRIFSNVDEAMEWLGV